MVIALLAGVGLGVFLQQSGHPYEPASKWWYERFADWGVNPDLGMGAAFGLFAVGLLVQTLLTTRKGFVYCGPSERVYRRDDPRRYRFWRAVQFLMTAALALLAIVFAAGAVSRGG